MKTKSLVKQMVYHEALTYCLNHPEYSLPNSIEAEAIDMPEHESFWIASGLDDRRMIYNKKKQYYTVSHPNIKHNVVVVKKKKEIK